MFGNAGFMYAPEGRRRDRPRMKIKTTSVRRLGGRKIPTWLINKVAARAAPWLRALVDRRREAAILKAHRVHGIPLDAARLYTGIAESDSFTAEEAHKVFAHLCKEPT
jgi:hypothetical protein